jgi:hypothetical protein
MDVLEKNMNSLNRANELLDAIEMLSLKIYEG